ncbi:MAG: hypothetical protein ACYTEY_19280 [Planctomycetota bacterium]
MVDGGQLDVNGVADPDLLAGRHAVELEDRAPLAPLIRLDGVRLDGEHRLAQETLVLEVGRQGDAEPQIEHVARAVVAQRPEMLDPCATRISQHVRRLVAHRNAANFAVLEVDVPQLLIVPGHAGGVRPRRREDRDHPSRLRIDEVELVLEPVGDPEVPAVEGEASRAAGGGGKGVEDRAVVGRDAIDLVAGEHEQLAVAVRKAVGAIVRGGEQRLDDAGVQVERKDAAGVVIADPQPVGAEGQAVGVERRRRPRVQHRPVGGIDLMDPRLAPIGQVEVRAVRGEAGGVLAR